MLVQNFVKEIHKRFFNIASVFCTCLEELVSTVLCELFGFLKFNLSFWFQIAFISEKQNLYFFVQGFFQFSLPFLNVVKALLRTYVINDDCSMSLFVVASSNCLVLLLARSIPELNLNHFVFVLKLRCLKIYSDCRSRVEAQVRLDEFPQDVCLSNSGVSDQNDFDQQVRRSVDH